MLVNFIEILLNLKLFGFLKRWEYHRFAFLQRTVCQVSPSVHDILQISPNNARFIHGVFHKKSVQSFWVKKTKNFILFKSIKQEYATFQNGVQRKHGEVTWFYNTMGYHISVMYDQSSSHCADLSYALSIDRRIQFQNSVEVK